MYILAKHRNIWYQNLFLIILFIGLFISGCIYKQPAVQNLPTPENITVAPPAKQETPEIFDVGVSSLICSWTVKTNEYGVKSDCVRIIAKGIVQGPVGARVELPILSWSDDAFDCGLWMA